MIHSIHQPRIWPIFIKPKLPHYKNIPFANCFCCCTNKEQKQYYSSEILSSGSIIQTLQHEKYGRWLIQSFENSSSYGRTAKRIRGYFAKESFLFILCDSYKEHKFSLNGMIFEILEKGWCLKHYYQWSGGCTINHAA